MSPALSGAAFLVAAAVTPGCIRLAHRTGMVDRPGPLKSQAAPVAYLGGVAVILGVAIGVSYAKPFQLLPLTAAVLLGLADDRASLPVWPRVAGQIALGLLVAATAPLHLAGPLGVPLLVVATVVLVNGMNLLDGLDLLAGGVAAVASAAFALLLSGSGRQIAASVAGATVGFLVLNRPPARIYLGDGGAYLLGTALSLLLAWAWAPGVAASRGTVALCVVVVPVAEVAFAVLRRLRGRRSLLSGDRGHPYDLLVARGWTTARSATAYVLAEATVCAGALSAAAVGGMRASVTAAVACALLVLLLGATTGALSPTQSSNA